MKKTGSLQQFEESQKAANLRYRTRWKTDKDYYATETYSGTIWHELGHAVDIASGQKWSGSLSATSILDELSVRVSAYAGSTQNVRVSKQSEAWAENFAAFMDGGKNKGRVPNEIAKMIEASLGKRTTFIDKSGKSDIIKVRSGSMPMNLQFFAKVPDEKLLEYALNPEHRVGKEKAKVFKEALGYTQDNYERLKAAILENYNEDELVFKGESQYGKRYEQIMDITGINGKTAKVLTA